MCKLFQTGFLDEKVLDNIFIYDVSKNMVQRFIPTADVFYWNFC